MLVWEPMMNEFKKEVCRLHGASHSLLYRQHSHLLIVARQKT